MKRNMCTRAKCSGCCSDFCAMNRKEIKPSVFGFGLGWVDLVSIAN